MAIKNIIVLSDGTGNAASSLWRTNVWRLYQSLATSPNQICRYDDGIGSSRLKPFALVAGAFGYGFKRNLLDLYKFVCRNYDGGTRIYAFGFSRGAFTVRALILLILQQGLVPFESERDLDARANEAYGEFRSQSFRSIIPIEPFFRAIGNIGRWITRKWTGRVPYWELRKTEVGAIEFVGVWDTVGAYGLPVDEMTRGVSKWLFALGFAERALHPKVKRACQALSLDDERTTFHPVLWSEEFEAPARRDSLGERWLKDERISQVWFSGAHANVGGGYPDDGLAFLPLCWLMTEAKRSGLQFKSFPAEEPDAFRSIGSSCNKQGRLYDSRSGLGGYYRYGPRKVADLCRARFSRKQEDRVVIRWPKIHESVFDRLRSGVSAYAPIGLPANYCVATDDGRVLLGRSNPYETPREARARAKMQERVWNLVWFRKIIYYATIASTFHLAFFWLFHDQDRTSEFSSQLRPVSELARMIESFAPRWAHWWTDWYASNPESFLIGVAALALCLRTSAKLRFRINDEMRSIWVNRKQGIERFSSLDSTIYRLRTSRVYLAFVQLFRFDLLPMLGVLAFVTIFWFSVLPATHLLANIVDSTGVYCQGTPEELLRAVDRAASQESASTFETSAVCWASGLSVRNGFKYEVSIVMIDPWSDGEHAITPNGYRSSTSEGFARYLNYLAVPLRRVLFRPWFRLLMRVGLTGTDEYFLDLYPVPNTYPQVYKDTIKADRSGELFFYVNDGLIPIPGLIRTFYRNNKGSARITVRLL